jgi:hypothetical protein
MRVGDRKKMHGLKKEYQQQSRTAEYFANRASAGFCSRPQLVALLVPETESMGPGVDP